MTKLARLARVALFVAAVTGCGGREDGPETPGARAPGTTGPAAKAPAPTLPVPAPPAAAPGAAEEIVEAMLVLATAEPDEGPAPLEVRLDVDVEGGKAPFTHQWTFGDGSPPSAEENPTHVFEKPGTYRVDLTTRDSSDQDDRDHVVIVVR